MASPAAGLLLLVQHGWVLLTAGGLSGVSLWRVSADVLLQALEM